LLSKGKKGKKGQEERRKREKIKKRVQERISSQGRAKAFLIEGGKRKRTNEKRDPDRNKQQERRLHLTSI